MAAVAATASLLSEFQVILELLKSEPRIACYGTNLENKGCKKRCGNWLAKSTSSELKTMILKLMDVLKKPGNGIVVLLEKISSLVMCKRRHQSQAIDKCKEWTEKLTSETSQGKDHVLRNVDFISSIESPSNETSDRSISGRKATANIQKPAQVASFGATQLHSEANFDDSGYFTDEEEDLMTDKITTPGAPGAPGDDEPSLSASANDYMALNTPQRPPPPVSYDSGFSEPTTHESIKIEQCPESPSATQARKRRQGRANAKSSPPTVLFEPEALIQQNTSSGAPSIPTLRTFVPASKYSSREVSKKLREYLETPLLPKSELKYGQIYCFRIEHCKYTKIGLTTKSLSGRTKQHKKCGWWNAQNMIHQKVPHVARVEKIIHRYLDANRMYEVQMPKGSNGRKCKHQRHEEWFDVDFTKLYFAVKAWNCWMESTPYVKIDGKFRLRPVWKDHLKTLNLESSGDIWLKWISYYLPETMKWFYGTLQDGMKILTKYADGQYPVVDGSTEINEDELEPLEGLWTGLGEGAQHILRRSPCRSSTF